MFDHVTIRVSDRAASERFYTAVLAPLGIEPTHVGEQFAEWADFSLASADDEHQMTRGLHVGFGARTRELAAELWRAGTAAGYRDERARARGRSTAGTTSGPSCSISTASAEAVHHNRVRLDGNVDHLWIRVADVAASKRF